MLPFNFSKKREQRILIKSQLDEEVQPSDEKDYVQSIEGTKIKGTLEKPTKKKELVIPLLSKNNWRITSSPAEPDQRNSSDIDSLIPTTTNSNATLDLEQQAIQELLGSNQVIADDEAADVPLILQNKVPDGYEDDDNLNVSLRPEQSTLDDYERVPIEEYGLAMLRGMGWKKGEGIGLRNKRVVEIIEPKLRPKGLGLGAERPQMAQEVRPSSGASTENENLTLKKGSFIILNKGKNKGMYGKVEALDEDNNRLIVQLAINGTMITVSKFGMNLVTETEFKKKSKVLNNELYEEHKVRQDEAAARRKREAENEQNVSHKDNSRHQLSSSSSKNKSHSNGKSNKSLKSDRNKDWVRTNLRVRIIDSKFRKGKHYKKKFIVEDVLERDNFVLKSETGEVVEGVRSLQLETVIPKELHSLVCILSGRHEGKIGQLIDRNSRKEVGVVQIPDVAVLELTFDDICEYIGNPDDF